MLPFSVTMPEAQRYERWVSRHISVELQFPDVFDVVGVCTAVAFPGRAPLYRREEACSAASNEGQRRGAFERDGEGPRWRRA